MSIVGPQYGFGLYVHWPYCSRICPYCDFNVYAAKDRDTDPLVKAICADIQRHGRALPDHPPLDTVFLGGGTPSLLSVAQIEAILTTADQAFGLKPRAEITIEANPNDVLRSDLAGWAAAGVNRVSIGLQSLDDEALTFLGRDHNSAAALEAVAAVQATFVNHSVDLIYALPGQSAEAWQRELAKTLALGAPHLSLYELTIEERTAFGKRAARGELVPMDADAQADLYDLTQAVCDRAGLPAYEVSNHAKALPYEARHNHIYWASGDWIGVGPGAHGRLTLNGQRYATEAAKRPNDYIKAHTPTRTELDRIGIARELLAMGLRPISGLSLSRLETAFGQPLAVSKIEDMKHHNLLGVRDDRLSLTPQGRLLADWVTAQLAPG